MKITNNKEYEESLKVLSALIQLEEDMVVDIQSLSKDIEEYEKVHFPIERPPDYAILQFHIYDRLATTIDTLPLSFTDKTTILTYIIQKKDIIPLELMEKVRAINVKDLIIGEQHDYNNGRTN